VNRLLVSVFTFVVICGFLLWWFHPHQSLKRRTKALMNTLTWQRNGST